ncbi:hypothetical protein AURDEDRAFT_171256 [Auricularia subglabra TFB-10046 SS5]|nr:hypothetical protein AURDEDRAFT_171256 [Auricularia subglabra TFB-10046 SS5]
MLNVIDLGFWLQADYALGQLTKSAAKARVADGTVVRSHGCWVGEVQLGPIRAVGGFEVIDCKGSFDVLLGKPWLGRAGLCHDFAADELRTMDGTVRISNQTQPCRPQAAASPPPPLSSPPRADVVSHPPPMPVCPPHSGAPLSQPALPTEIPHVCLHAPSSRFAVCTCLEDALAQTRGMPIPHANDEAADTADAAEISAEAAPAEQPRRHTRRDRAREYREARELEDLLLEDAIRRANEMRAEAEAELLAVFDNAELLNTGDTLPGMTPLQEVLPGLLAIHDALAPARTPEMTMEQRMSPERVRAVLENVTIGNDLSAEQRGQVQDLISRFH